MTDKLKPLRDQIDAIDAQILQLLSQRGKVAQEVGHVKAETLPRCSVPSAKRRCCAASPSATPAR
jgi:chorismate mutase